MQISQTLNVLRNHKLALGWSITDMRGISPSSYMHKIKLDDDFEPSVEHQRRLKPPMQEVVKKQIIKWLESMVVYPILDWVSPIQYVPKKGEMIVVLNDKDELIPTGTVTG